MGNRTYQGLTSVFHEHKHYTSLIQAAGVWLLLLDEHQERLVGIVWIPCLAPYLQKLQWSLLGAWQ